MTSIMQSDMCHGTSIAV